MTLCPFPKRVLEGDSTAFDADKLVNIDSKTLNSWFPSDKQLPNVEERVIRLQELGEALTCEGNRFGGLAMNMVKSAKNGPKNWCVFFCNIFQAFVIPPFIMGV